MKVSFKQLVLCIFISNILVAAPYRDHAMIDNLKKYITIPDEYLKQIYAIAGTQESRRPSLERSCSSQTQLETCTLFKYFPALVTSIPYLNLANLPTPINYCKNVSFISGNSIFIKRDDLTAQPFGGNKVRKLEFLLADALEHDAKTIMTFGCAGSNHALVTAVYAHKIGLKTILMLKPQWNSHIVRTNLLHDLSTQAELLYAPNNSCRALLATASFIQRKTREGSFPYIIPTGGSCPLGIMGYVNAAFELKDQIKAGLMPEPERIYVPLGSAGTTTGLLLGIKAAGIKCQLHAIAVEPELTPGDFKKTIRQLFDQTGQVLQNADKNFPQVDFDEHDLVINTNFAGADYALFTQEDIAAINIFKDTENLTLDGVYTGKAAAALLHDLNQLHDKNSTILFWNTFCQNNLDNLEKLIHDHEYKKLPQAFHHYFETDVQDLDK